MPFGIGQPPTYTSIAVYMCEGGLKGPKSVKRNSIISIRSKVMAFLVILLSPRGPHRSRIVPIIPMSSPHRPLCPRHPHVVPIAPRRSPWSVVSTCCPHRPRHPHVIPVIPHIVPVIPTLFRSSPHHLQPPRYPLHPPAPPWGV